MGKKKFIKDLRDGEQADDLFMVKSCRLGETRNGNAYLSLVFADNSGEIDGRAWDNAAALERHCKAGAVVRVRGAVQTYRERLQIRVDDIEQAGDSTVDRSDFVAASRRAPDDMAAELEALIAEVGDPYLNGLLHRIFFATEIGAAFQTAPAAKGIHHAYRGGLLEHSLSMARAASLLASHYRVVDRDLVIAGALLHDIGKTVELDDEGGVIDYTDVGRLKGHLVIGCEFIGRQAELLPDFPAELLTHLQHLVLSHHGRLEFGSPVVPMTAEAMLLSFIDDMDAKMSLIDRLGCDLDSDEPVWSDYQRSLERFLLLRPATAAASSGSGEGGEAGPEHSMDPATRQQSLF